MTPVLQVLAYPVTDATLHSPSYEEFATGPAWGSPEVSPLRADDLADLPDAVVVTAEYDVLRFDGEAYAQAPSAAGARVSARRYAGVAHGFLRLHNHLDVAREALSDVATAVAEAVRPAD